MHGSQRKLTSSLLLTTSDYDMLVLSQNAGVASVFLLQIFGGMISPVIPSLLLQEHRNLVCPAFTKGSYLEFLPLLLARLDLNFQGTWHIAFS